jgi:hypothetical protein
VHDVKQPIPDTLSDEVHVAPSKGIFPSCVDDPSWVDEDGDGCHIYAHHIAVGLLTQGQACGWAGNLSDLLYSGNPAGAAKHCRATCGMCPQEKDEVHVAPSEGNTSCVDDPSWVDEDGDGCDVYAHHIAAGNLSQEQACGFEGVGDLLELGFSGNPAGAAKHCRATCGTCTAGRSEEDQQLSSPKVEMKSSTNEGQCVDDPQWVDSDGDGCQAYAEAIATGVMAQEEACGRAYISLESGNPGEASRHCLVTCGNCPNAAFEENDADMKDMIRLLVEEESERILQEANNEEPEEELLSWLSEVVTTTTMPVKSLPEQELPTNSTRADHYAQDSQTCQLDEQKEHAISSDKDVVKFAPVSKHTRLKTPKRLQKLPKV